MVCNCWENAALFGKAKKCLGKNAFQVIQEGELGFLLLVYRVTEGGIGWGGGGSNYTKQWKKYIHLLEMDDQFGIIPWAGLPVLFCLPCHPVLWLFHALV